MARIYKRPFSVFIVLWVITFILYLRAAEAGKVGEYYTEWLDVIQHKGFRYFLHPGDFPSLYHFTQITTYVFYRIFGFGPWPWHALALTVHVANATLLLLFFNRVLADSKVRHAFAVSAGTALLYCVSSYNTEVIVHEECYHYAQGFLLQLSGLFLLQRFLHHPKGRYALFAGLIFAAASFSIEVFYLTPVFTLSLILYYRHVLNLDKQVTRKALVFFLAPQLVIFIIHFILLHQATGHIIGHYLEKGSNRFPLEFLAKAPRYIFHVVFLGRYFPDAARSQFYRFSDTGKGMAISAVLMAFPFAWMALRFKKWSTVSKITMLFWLWALGCTGLVCMLAFPDTLLVLLDRYCYFMMPFIYLVLLLLLSRLRFGSTGITFFAAYFAINVFFTVQVNEYWHDSAEIITGLMKSFPDPEGKVVLLLNPPESMHGVLMIGSGAQSKFRQMYNFEHMRQIDVPVYDVASYNMNTTKDGAHVMVVYDSVMHCTLNQFGQWWWYNYKGAFSYENDEYKLNMADAGHWYELTLKHPAGHYLLLYQAGNKWKTVDWSKRGQDQY